MGFLIGKGNEDLQEFETTNQDIKFLDFKNPERSINKSAQSYAFREKGEFSYEFQFMSETYYRNLLYLCKNRSSLREGMILIPIPYASQQSSCILKPTYSTSNKFYYGSSAPANIPWDKKLTDLAYAEISSTQYGYIRVDDSNSINLVPSPNYNFYLAQFSLSDFITNFSYKDLRRLTLSYIGMNSSPMRFFIWSPTYLTWYLIDDRFYYDDSSFADTAFYLRKQLVSSFTLPWGNTSIYSDFVDGSGNVMFMIAGGTVNQPLLLQYLRLFVNGYWVMATDPQDFENYSVAFTGAGRDGNLKLMEL